MGLYTYITEQDRFEKRHVLFNKELADLFQEALIYDPTLMINEQHHSVKKGWFKTVTEQRYEIWHETPAADGSAYQARVQIAASKDISTIKAYLYGIINGSIRTLLGKNENMGEISDGYHTFNELYEFRKAYNVALFNTWAAKDLFLVHKSIRHHDGQLCFGGGWFIVVAQLPNGQISNHYEMKDWDLFKIPEAEKALYKFDGHTGKDVIDRLLTLKIKIT